jgi:hypothetical protein
MFINTGSALGELFSFLGGILRGKVMEERIVEGNGCNSSVISLLYSLATNWVHLNHYGPSFLGAAQGRKMGVQRPIFVCNVAGMHFLWHVL